DLAQKGDKVGEKQEYIIKMLEWQDADLRMPASVLNVNTGEVWNCPNIVDGKAIWIKTELPSL
ncbi:hypothetical protein KKC59_04490, partial [bacterium]|nr:hypothetical protein [bacterium]